MAIKVALLCVFAGNAFAAGDPIHIEVGLVADKQYPVDWFATQITSFMQANPDVVVDAPQLRRENKIKVNLQDLPGLPANVIGISSLLGYETALLVQKDLLVPIESFLPDPDFSKDLFYENTWDAVEFDGKTWGVPWVVDGGVLAYDEEMFKAAGLPGPPKTLGESLEYAKRLSEDKHGVAPVQYGFGFQNRADLVYFFMTMVYQEGHKIIENGQANLQGPEMRQVFDKFSPFYHSKNYTVDLNAGLKSRCGMLIGTFETLPRIIDIGRYKLAPLPSEKIRLFPSPGRQYLAVRKSTPEQEAASWRLIKWISRRDASLPERWQGFPARKDIVEWPEVAKMEDPTYKNLPLLVDSTSISKTLALHVQGLEEAGLPVAIGLLGAMEGKGEFEDLMLQAEKQANAILKPMLPTAANSFNLYK
jgi:ABC-type glycerol-3-phosphate transport system substrate-binding protein